MSRDKPLPDETASLARLLDISNRATSPWDPAELGEILEHQLATPLASDLESFEGGWPALLAAAGNHAGPPIRTFGELLSHPDPPKELLGLVKRFAKHCRRQAESPLPDEIATVLYFLAITVARLRLKVPVSGLDDPTLAAGLQWALDQSWLDDTTRTLLRQGLSSLDV